MKSCCLQLETELNILLHTTASFIYIQDQSLKRNCTTTLSFFLFPTKQISISHIHFYLIYLVKELTISFGDWLVPHQRMTVPRLLAENWTSSVVVLYPMYPPAKVQAATHTPMTGYVEISLNQTGLLLILLTIS